MEQKMHATPSPYDDHTQRPRGTLPGMPDAATPLPILRPTGKRKITKKIVPNNKLERGFWDAGCEIVVGIDEVGRGAWAGPLAIGAAIIPRDKRITGVRDSKLLSEKQREQLFAKVAAWCVGWHVGVVSHEECDAIGMSAAQKLAARRAIEGLGVTPDAVLVDGSWDFVETGNVQRLIKGDAVCLSIAAASVLAKVTRDRIMRAEAEHYPHFAFEDNKGYPCPKHKAALAGWGPSAIHRRSWVFMESMPWSIERLVPMTAPATATSTSTSKVLEPTLFD
jgi:ribonuclease HII